MQIYEQVGMVDVTFVLYSTLAKCIASKFDTEKIFADIDMYHQKLILKEKK